MKYVFEETKIVSSLKSVNDLLVNCDVEIIQMSFKAIPFSTCKTCFISPQFNL